ncbi:MAG: ATP-dependent DNA helicase RecG [Cellvibrionaceae bacterium]|nr:ATP-dependent DNA helicase RecG [Cellvibrionaceae bacterium]
MSIEHPTQGQRLLSQRAITELKGVGPQLASRLQKLNIENLQDLVFHLPFRYIDRTRITPIGQLQAHQQAVIEGEVHAVDVVFGKRRSLLCRLSDTSGSVCLRFYHFSSAQKNALAAGTTLRCFGEVRQGITGLEFYHPEYQRLQPDKPQQLEATLTPVYSVTEGISQARLRLLIEQALAVASAALIPDLSTAEGLPPLVERLRYLHFPPQDAPLTALTHGQHPYQQSLIREELTAYQLSLLRQKQRRSQQQGVALSTDHTLLTRFLQTLDFTLTGAQARVVAELSEDLQTTKPMMRLLQGDVGSGKTVVAALAALTALNSGFQVAIMAPTDILAEQHKSSFQTWFADLGIAIGCLSGKLKTAERRQQLAGIASGDLQLIIGTHALFQQTVVFKALGLVIIDEQHRFGVHQRLQLRDKGHSGGRIPHQLIMTATPIPRTLAMSAYADLDYSVIDELPAGRIPVQTVVISQQRRPAIIERIRIACSEGRQAYWVCTLIEESETLSAEAAEDTEALLKDALPDIRIGLVHGRLKASEKDQLMSAFKAGDIQLLVATTVIEVGVNVPNASLMIIENPERLGLAQLHQLRGRVGRGNAASHCVLLYGDDLSQQGRARLQAMRDTNDGFKIAQIDLELRGPGEVLGTRQTGEVDFKLADLQRDLQLMPQIKQAAEAWLAQTPETVEQLIQRWIGNSERFAQV